MKDDKAAQSLPLHAHLPGLCQSVQEHTTIFSRLLQGFLEKASLPSNWDGWLVTVTVFIVKLTESRIAWETGFWMSCEHALCKLLREDPP